MLQFVKMMINQEYGITVLSVTRNKSQDRVIEYLVGNVDEADRLVWYYVGDSVAKAVKKLGMSKAYFDKVLRDLVELGVLHKKARGVYILSKEYFQSIKNT